ncbi:MAG: hypothetical protein LUQ65_10030, partial [Candidatus Helarchaeota archaeon]|nr:hypothetical protein [Candidatus Helarchaeota archaeon]
MASSEERRCDHCGTFHLRNISFFAYWAQCKQCGLSLCQRCSGYGDRKVTQFAFLAYMLVSYILYLGLFLIKGPIEDPSINILSSYTLASILLFLPFLMLLLILRSIVNRFQKAGAITACPKCNGPMQVITHDMYLYFFLFLIHILYISTILNETGIYLYKNPLLLSINLWFLVVLVGLIVSIIFLFKKIGGTILPGYKMNTRVWIGEIFAIFIYISLNVILLVLFNDNNILFSFGLFYQVTSVVFWFFPAFLIGSIIYKLTQKYLLNVNKPRFIQILIAMGVILLPFYIWGIIGVSLGKFYFSIFLEIIPIFFISLLLGTAIASLFRKYIPKSRKSDTPLYIKILISLGISLFTGFLLTENLFYLIAGTLLLDNFSNIITIIILVIFLISCLMLLYHELTANWLSIETQW